jgi:hypothetical protein
LKDQIIAFEPHDDMAMLRDRILRAQTDRILLQLSRAASLRRLDLMLAARWANQVGAELVVVSTDPDAIDLCRRATVRWHPSVEAAVEQVDSEPPKRRNHANPVALLARRESRVFPQSIVAKANLGVATRTRSEVEDLAGQRPHEPAPLDQRAASFLFIAPLALLTTTAALLIPSAKVRVSLPASSQTVAIALDPSLGSMLTVNLSITESMATTGHAVVPTTFATGEISLTNHAQAVIAIPPGTRFRDPVAGIEFETLEGEWLDPQSSTVVGIRALVPGPSGNRPAGSIREALGLPATRLDVRQSAATIGGQTDLRATVAAADLSTLRTLAGARLTDTISSALESEATQHDVAIVEGSIIIRQQGETASATPGTAVDEVQLVVAVQAQALAFPRQVVLDLARQSSAQHGSADATALPLSADPRLELDASGNPRIVLSALTMEADLPSSLAERVVYRTPTIARQVIENLVADSSVEIRLSPAWWPIMPAFPSRVTIVAAPKPQSPEPHALGLVR